MELSPQSVASTTFKTVKKGYDPDEVRAYLTQLATAIESTQSQAAAMEARARAAVARLQELAANPAQASAPAPAPAAVTPITAGVEESETISRTLLLAQRTADSTIAEAEADAKRIRDEAGAEARDAVEAARADARRASEAARIEIESEVQALLARREFLLSDVEHLEQHVVTHRERIREVAGSLVELIDRAPGGLADIRRPLMSAVADVGPAHVVQDETVQLDTTAWMSDSAEPESAITPADAVSTSDESTAGVTNADDTPPGGTAKLIEPVTGEIPAVTRPHRDAFNIGRDDQR